MALTSLTSLIENLPKDIVQCLTQTLIDDYINKYEKIQYDYDDDGVIMFAYGHNFYIFPIEESYESVKQKIENLSDGRISLVKLTNIDRFLRIRRNGEYISVSTSGGLSVLFIKEDFLDMVKTFEDNIHEWKQKHDIK